MSETQDFLVVTTIGPENNEKLLMPFIVANAALLMDIKTTIFMMANAVALSVKGEAEKVEPLEGMPIFKELLSTFLELGGDIKLCGPCCNHRNITPEDLIEGAEIGGAAGLVDMMISRKVVTY